MMVALAGWGGREGLLAPFRSPRQSQGSFGLLGRNSCRFPLGSLGEKSAFSKRKLEVHVASDYSDSKPESSKRRGKWDYHPLEDLSKMQKDEIEHAGHGQLSSAEVARTVSEVNWRAFIFSPVVAGGDAVYGTEVQYLVDDHGDLYFEIENDNEFLQTLSSIQIYKVLVGYDNVDRLQFSDVMEAEVEDNDDDSDSEDESSDDESEIIDVEIEIVEDLEEIDDSGEESFGSLGGWGGGFESLNEVHPMDFASKLSESVSTDYMSEIDKPTRRLTITGIARPVTAEEEHYVQGIWYDRFLLPRSEETNEVDNGDHENSFDGDGGPRTLQSESKSVRQDGDTHMTDIANEWKPETSGSQNGTGNSESRDGADAISNEEDVHPQSRSIGKNDLSGSPNSKECAANDLDDVRDGRLEGSDSDEEASVSGAHDKRNPRNKKRGAMLDSSNHESDALQVEETSEIKLPPGAILEGDAAVGDWAGRGKKPAEFGSSFFKLDLVSILLERSPGAQSAVEVRDFAYAEPDPLAHVSSTIMKRINSGGKRVENALKALCERAKGLAVEEVYVVGVDCLGLDLRVRCGIEMKTIRLSFNKRARCEETAEKLIDQLLFPRHSQRRPRKRSQD